jgi:hypothetical protein
MGKLPLGAGVLLASFWACGGPQGRGGPGKECFRDDECEFGLVCAAVGTGERTCTNDVSGLVEQYVPEGLPMPAAGGTTGAGGMPGAGTPNGGAPSGAGSPSMAGAPPSPSGGGGSPSMAGAPSASGGGSSEPSGGAPADAAAGSSG